MNRIFALALALVSLPANAFETALHAGITQEAIQQVGGFDAATVAAIVEGNLNTDHNPVLFNTHAAHFDSEKLAEGSARLQKLLNKAMSDLQSCNRGDALDAIGTSLHAIQDFFAHSNFVELHMTEDKPHIDLFSLKNPPASLACVPPGGSTGLTTGYWPNEPAKMRKIGKCTHDELAKDSPATAPKLFPVARARAVTESTNYLLKVQAAIQSYFGSHALAVLRYLKDSRSAGLPGTYCAPGCSAGGPQEVGPGFPLEPLNTLKQISE